MKLPPETEKLLLAYFAGDTSDETIKAMEAWLRQDPTHPRILAEYGLVDRLLAHEQKKLDTSAIFALLLEAEEAAEPMLVEVGNKPRERRARVSSEDDLTLRKVGSALSYLVTTAQRSPVVRNASIAALLFIAALLGGVLLWNNRSPQATEITDNAPADTNQPNPVATLTATHNAQWDSQPAEDLRRGSKLHPNQRLTLTAGFATITTNDGAVAIIQAPATIEFTHNDNALELHSGKLVGICETESSKGFVVSTPHMDITDLGTRFGVDATQPNATEVHVFDGKVQAARSNSEPVVLIADQSAKASAADDTITAIDHAPDRFATLLPNTIELPGTGSGVAAKKVDPNWQIVAIDGKPLPNPRTVIAGQLGSNIDASKPTQWLSMRTRGMRYENGQASFIFRTTLDLPAAVQPGKHRLAIRYMADNELRSIRVNGQLLDTRIPQPETIRDVSPPIGFEINPELKAGANVIEFEVIDHAFQGTSGAFVGLYIDWELLPLAKGQDP